MHPLKMRNLNFNLKVYSFFFKVRKSGKLTTISCLTRVLIKIYANYSTITIDESLITEFEHLKKIWTGEELLYYVQSLSRPDLFFLAVLNQKVTPPPCYPIQTFTEQEL